MVTSVNSSLINYLSTQGLDGTVANALGSKTSGMTGSAGLLQAQRRQALQRAASTAKGVNASQALDTAQKTLAKDLRTAMSQAGVKLTGAIEFTVKSDGSVDMKGTDADEAAVKAFLKADASQPSFATRIATQARDAMKQSTTVQQSAAMAQAAKLSRTPGGVMALYASLMQQTSSTSVVFSLSATSSTLTYPGSLTTAA
ncbi:hypothetical protein [Roseateles sp.]|uniref:hypothetical protein n=1 Tax=Roseateles sp. TaxID=1971397 RepID=UPI00396476B0